jgi:hypothetical protein
MSKFDMRDLANVGISFDGLAQHLELETTTALTETEDSTEDTTDTTTTDAIERNKLSFYAPISPLIVINPKKISKDPKEVFDRICEFFDFRMIGWFKKDSSTIQSGFHKFTVYKDRKNHEHCVLEYQKLGPVDDYLYEEVYASI